MKKIILLGGEGFIGRNLAEGLGVQYDCISAGASKSPFSTKADKYFLQFNPYVSPASNQYDVYIQLINNDVSLVEVEQQEGLCMKNLSIPSGAHLIVFSSAVVYANPSSEYGMRKAALETFYVAYCQANDINLTIVRLFNIFGPYQIPFKQGSLVANLMYNQLVNAPTEINDMSAARDFIYSKDLVKIISKIIHEKHLGTLDVASGNMITIEHLINTLESNVIHEELQITDKKITETLVCPEADLTDFMKSSQTDFVSALQQTYSFYQGNLESLRKIMHK